MADGIQKSSDLWDLEHHLTQRRKEIDRKYDFRGSRLTDVVGETLVRKSPRRGRSARIAGREDEINPFFRPVSQRRRSLICILSAIAWFRKLSNSSPGSVVGLLPACPRALRVTREQFRKPRTIFGRAVSAASYRGGMVPIGCECLWAHAKHGAAVAEGALYGTCCRSRDPKVTATHQPRDPGSFRGTPLPSRIQGDGQSVAG